MEQKQERIFANPLFWKSRLDQQPEFVRGGISINVKDMVDFLQNPEYEKFISPKGYMNFQLLRPKNGGNNYFVLDTYIPKPKTTENTEPTELTSEEMKFHSPLGEDYPTDDVEIPF